MVGQESIVRPVGMIQGRAPILGLVWSWVALLTLAPLAVILAVALSSPADTVPPFAFAADLSSLSAAATDPIYRAALWLSLRTAALATAGCLAIGYPMALAISRMPDRWRHVLLLAAMLPFWTGFLMRINAWIGLLRDDGVVDRVFAAAGLAPPHLLYTGTAMWIGMVYTYLPFMVLPIYARLSKLDPRLEESAADLGASPACAFVRVVLPLSMPGVAAGVALVFIPATGEFVIPDLLGGPGARLIGRVLWEEFFNNRDWPMAASLAILLLPILLLPPLYAWLARARG